MQVELAITGSECAFGHLPVVGTERLLSVAILGVRERKRTRIRLPVVESGTVSSSNSIIVRESEGIVNERNAGLVVDCTEERTHETRRV